MATYQTETSATLTEIFGPKGRLAEALPGFEYRPGQLRMAQAVEAAILQGDTLVAEAGTGTGKTLAYLVPALLSGQKTVVATGTKTLQEQLVFKDVPLLAGLLGRPFAVSLMKGRGNYLCRRGLRRALAERHTRAERLALVRIQRWSATSSRGDRAELPFLAESDPLWDGIAATSEHCVGAGCEDFDDCFLTRVRREAAAADLVVVNHHLLLADAVLRDEGPFRVIPPYHVLILDEAHLLEEVATDFFGAEISTFRVERLVQDVAREWAGLGVADRAVPEQGGRVAEAAARFFGGLPAGEAARRLAPELLEGPGGEAGRELVAALLTLADLLQALPGRPEGVLACARRAREQAAVLSQLLVPAAEGPELPAVRWLERRGRGLVLHFSPLDVSTDFQRTVLASADSLILTSGTLDAGGRFDFFRGRLGIEEAREFRTASPFDFAEQALLYLPDHLPDPRQPAFLAAAAEEIRQILELSRGRGLVLFTSLEAMQATYRLLEGRLPFPLMVQGQAPRGQLLAAFRQGVDSVLLATRSFWQGVDIVGESLSCLIVHKLPFAFPGDPILEARLEYIQQQGGDPFWGYQVPAAIITLRQGLGRLIRSGQDRGVLCILDGRLRRRGYGRAFLESLPPCPVTEDREDLRRFFGEP